jgi:hypothetical protein
MQNCGEEIIREKRVIKKTERDELLNARQIVFRFGEDRWMEVSLVSCMIMSFAAYAIRIAWRTLLHSASIRSLEIYTDYYSA